MADVIGWLLLVVLVALLGALIIGFWVVILRFVDVQKNLHEIRTQFDTIIRLQSSMLTEWTVFKTDVRHLARQARLE